MNARTPSSMPFARRPLALALPLMCVALLSGIGEARGNQPGQAVAFANIEVTAITRRIDILLLTSLSPGLSTELTRQPFDETWVATSLDVATGLTAALAIVSVSTDARTNSVTVQLDPATDPALLDRATRLVLLTYQRGPGAPRATWPPASTGAISNARFTSALTVEDANVYFSGKITAVSRSKPNYAFEAKLKKDWFPGQQRGAWGLSAEIAADEQTNVDPDRIAFGGTYRRSLRTDSRGTILHVQLAGGEFTRKAPRTKTFLSSAAIEQIVVPTIGPPTAKVAVILYGGVEVGSNFSNALDQDEGSGLVSRFRVAPGPVAAFRLTRGPFKGFKASALWDVRFLANEEIDPGRLNEAGLPTLTRRTRQHLKADFDLTVNDYVSLTIQHRQGYLPPTYKKVNQSVAVSLTFKGKWI